MSTRPDGTEHAFELLARLAREDGPLSAELEGSLVEFFGGPIPAGDALATLQHARRHLEWFLLERHSPSLFGVPVERMLDRWRVAAEEAGVAAQAVVALLQSCAGAFQVTALADDGAWLNDLAGLGDYALEGAPASLAVGDLLIGRIYPGGGDLYRASPGIGLLREPAIRAAIALDLERVRKEGGKVRHLSQLELERLFFRSLTASNDEVDPVEEARAILMDQGLTSGQVDGVFASLSSSPLRPEKLVPGAADALGEVMDELAFETQIDLEGARTALTRAWSALSCAAPAETPDPEGPGTGRRSALESFDQGRASGRDLDELFRQLELDLQLSPEVEADPGELSPAPDFPGVVGAMLDEFRWEIEQQEGAEVAARHAALAPLGEYAGHLGCFEELDPTELLRFTTFWIPERGGLDGEGARDLLESLGAFCTWAEAAHEIPLATEFAPTLDGLRESLPRILELNRSLPDPPDDATGVLYEVRADASGRFGGLLDREGRAHDARLDQPVADRLRPGDRLRGMIDLDGSLSLYRCYPPEAGGLSA